MTQDLSLAVRSTEQGVTGVSKPKFSHLHLHTPYSLLDGFCRIEELVDLAVSYGMDSIGVSEHGNCHSHVEFYNACKKKGIKPVLGCEVYTTPHRTWKKPEFTKVVYLQKTIAYRTKKELKPAGAEEISSPTPAQQKRAYQEMLLKKLKEKNLDLKPSLDDLELANYYEYQQDQGIDLTHSLEFQRLEGEDLSRKEIEEALNLEINSKGLILSGVPDTRMQRLFEIRPKIGHLLLIAKDNAGYENLLKITTIAQLEGVYYKPRADYRLLKQYGKGIIATTACIGSEVNQLIRNGKHRAAKNLIRFFQSCFDELYLELQPSNLPEQHLVNEVLIAWSKEMNLPLVATSDAHMLRPEELPIHKALTLIGKGEDDSDISVYEHCYFKTIDEMLDGGIPPEALQNAWEIAQKCNVELEMGELKLPKFPVPEGYTLDSYLSQLANDALFDLMMKKDINVTEYQERMNFELEVIKNKGLSGYFLIVWDFIDYAKRNGILIGPGRGSAAGSLVCYLLKITNIDPIKYNLLFQRMLNPERKSMPDIDVDIDYLRRHEVIEYVTKKYGADCVAQIGTFGTLSTRAALKDIGRGMGIDHNIVNEMNKLIPSLFGKVYTIEEALNEVKELKPYQEQYPDLFDMAKKVLSLPRQASIHACFDADTLVTTSLGLKRIIDVEVGDEVLTHTRAFKKVHSLMKTEAESTYLLKTNSSFPVEVTGNHPMYVREMTSKRPWNKEEKKLTRIKEFGEPQWKQVSDLSVGRDYIGIPLNGNALFPVRDYNLPWRSNHFWWIIGRYLGDGWTESYVRTDHNDFVEQRVIICCGKHKTETEDIQLRLNELGFSYRIEETRTVYKIHLNVPGLYDYLQEFGRYAHGKKIPGHVLDLPVGQLDALLKGLFSADGHFLVSEQRQSLKTVSKELAIGVMQCINKVYKRHAYVQILPPKIEEIEGRIVHSREKYQINFTYDVRKKERSIYEDGYIWTRVSGLEELYEPKTMYNLTVYDDSSYVVHGLAAHNCGLVIGNEPIAKSIPLMAGKNGEIVTQYDGPTLEKAGFVKMDMLGLKNLSVIAMARDLVHQNHGVYIDVDELEPTDPKVFEIIRQGQTLGLFQIESEGMQKMFKGMNNITFESLIAGVSLYRPGPMAFIPEYVDRANGYKEVEYLTPELEEITKDTFGILVYQEQAMRISTDMAAYSMGDSDVLRKAIGKKDEEVMRPALIELRRRLLEAGQTEKVADHVIKLIEPFVGYGFNRSHAAAYSFIAYQTAYFKTYYPNEFMAALLTVFGDNEEKVRNYITEANRLGMKVLQPDVNKSDLGFSIEDGTLRFGLLSIKGLGQAAIEYIMDIRPFDSLESIVESIPKKVLNKRGLDSLTLCGAFDSLAPDIDNRYSILQKVYHARGDKKVDLTEHIIGFTHKAKLEKEKELLGLFISGHPLDGYAKPVNWDAVYDGESFDTAGVITSFKETLTKREQKMAFVNIDTLEGAKRIVLFPNEYELVEGQLEKDMVLKLTLTKKYDARYDERSYIVKKINIPKRMNKEILAAQKENEALAN